jgi:cytochrome c oxidase cbb3-type subunit III
MSSGISIYIIVLTALNIIGAMWVLWWMRKRRGDETRAGADTTGHVWDGDLREYNNPLPRWWLWLFILTTVFSLGYMVLYPGWGTWRGTLNWTSIAQHEAQQQVAEAQAQQILAPFASQSIEQLRSNPAALAVGRNLYDDNCTLCHGSDARGAMGFPNLTDKDWLWGGAPDAIETTIAAGRTGVMIGWRDALGGDGGVEDTVAYVLSLSGRSVPAGNIANGKQFYTTNCIACHGEDGRGNPLLGAPNLTDQVWLYGGSVNTIRDVIANGRQGQMPAQSERLGADRIRLLAAYVLRLGDGA